MRTQQVIGPSVPYDVGRSTIGAGLCQNAGRKQRLAAALLALYLLVIYLPAMFGLCQCFSCEFGFTRRLASSRRVNRFLVSAVFAHQAARSCLIHLRAAALRAREGVGGLLLSHFAPFKIALLTYDTHRSTALRPSCDWHYQKTAAPTLAS
jgi:hypothetical protein